MTLLDDILSKGYGIISAISLFIAVNVAEELFWACLSPLKESNEFEGVFIALFDFLIKDSNKLSALKKAFYRDTHYNLNNILATVFVFFIVNFF